MKTVFMVLGFGAIWLATFVPAWILLVKLAVASVAPKKRWLRILVLAAAYEAVIVAPYVFALVLLGGTSRLPRYLATSVLVMATVIAFVQIRGLKKIERTLWSYYSFFYDNLLRFYPYQELVELVGDRALKYINPDSKVVDLGGGTGNVSSYILERQPNADITIVEPVPGMLRRAKQKLKERYKHARFEEADALGFLAGVKPGSLDVVIVSNVLYIIKDRDKFWDLLLNSMSPKGVAIITNSDRTGSSALIRYHKKHAKARHLYHPGLIMVGFIDNLISQLASGESFHFVPQKTIEKELALRRASALDVMRCYGGDKDGVNLLFTVSKRK